MFAWEAKLRSGHAAETSKRMLREEPFVTLSGERFAATTAAAGVFRAMTGAAQEEAAIEIGEAVVTLPANAAGAARFRTREAVRAAGITVRTLLNEPTAAAIAYAHEMEVDGEFLVFDWGGGTMNPTLLLHDDGFFDEKASRGVNRLGGLEIDARLRRMVLDRAPAQSPWSDSEKRQFNLDIERAKILLSQQESVRIVTPDTVAVEIGQDEFSKAVQDLINHALDPIEQCLEQVRITPHELTAVLVIGCSSQIPAVRAAVSEALDCELVGAALCDPMTAVAEGAAISAAAMCGELKSIIRVVDTHALGTVTKDREGQRRFSALIRRNQRLPQQRIKSYEPTKNNVSRLTVEVREGHPDRPVDHPDNAKLTDLVLTYPHRSKAEGGVFDLEYAYSKEGLLAVKATLQKIGQVILDGEVKVFGDGHVAPEVKQELDRLSALTPAARPSTAPTHPHQKRRAGSSGYRHPVPEVVSGPDAPRSSSPVASAETTPLVVDGSNLAWNGRPPRAEGGKPSFAALEAAIRSLRFKHPDRDIHVVVDATLRHDVSSEKRPEVEAAMAAAVGGVIVSNDNFAPFQKANPWLHSAGRVMGATHSLGIWVFNPRTPNAAATAY
ncbi:Hsp70 family protein [Streptomyces sp. NPDC045456]|uniref:Hsp70 family protein n=1 Tax=Streptomyces sp. NPDC045456 TaxID=3155254 RepID=UPI0033D04DD0